MFSHVGSRKLEFSRSVRCMSQWPMATGLPSVVTLKRRANSLREDETHFPLNANVKCRAFRKESYLELVETAQSICGLFVWSLLFFFLFPKRLGERKKYEVMAHGTAEIHRLRTLPYWNPYKFPDRNYEFICVPPTCYQFSGTGRPL